MRRIAATIFWAFTSFAAAQSSWVNGPESKGEVIKCDLPDSQQFKNIGSKIDGAGMCVFSSVEMAAIYQGLEQMRGYRNWWASVSRGGGWPEQVDKSLAAWWRFKKIDPIPYAQYEGKTPESFLETINKTNRMACITYGFSPRYGKGNIAHMTNCILYGNQLATVLDNNFIGEKQYEWMAKPELIRRTKLMGGSAWVFVWLTPGSPPPPKAKVHHEKVS